MTLPREYPTLDLDDSLTTSEILEEIRDDLWPFCPLCGTPRPCFCGWLDEEE